MLNKQQLRAVLDILKKSKNTRPILTNMVWRGEYLHATDGYVAVRFKVSDSSDKNIALSFEKLERFYKLMGTKDLLKLEEFKTNGEEEWKYPNMETLWQDVGMIGKAHHHFSPELLISALKTFKDNDVSFKPEGNVIKIKCTDAEAIVCGLINKDDE